MTEETGSELPLAAIESYIRTGRDLKYKSHFAQMLVRHGAKGLPYDTFSASLGTTNDNVKKWEVAYTTFKRAKELYDGLFKDYWTKRLAECDKNDSSPILLALARNYLGIRTTDSQAQAITEVTSIEIIQEPKSETAN